MIVAVGVENVLVGSSVVKKKEKERIIINFKESDPFLKTKKQDNNQRKVNDRKAYGLV